MHYHLDPVGGVAGDMFAAAMLDYRPDWERELSMAIRDSGLLADLDVRVPAHNDGMLAGHRFEVFAPDRSGSHQHRDWRDIRQQLRDCALDTSLKQCAIAIFTLLAEAEAKVHGISVDTVAFHEVGAWDSIVDIVAAAWLIERSGAISWSCAPIPLGRGYIATAHGRLPLPAPATTELLTGFPLFDDGVEGERITPTGAAILKYLDPDFGARPTPSLLVGQGFGFGSKRFQEFSNLLRVSVFEPASSPAADESVVLCLFEVDDQTPEDLAVGLERLRELAGVLDVIQSPVFGKKGRIAMQIQVLGVASRIDTIIDHCFIETTTLGVRWQAVNRKTLVREEQRHQLAGDTLRIKRAARPNGVLTRKVEMDDLAGTPGGHSGREQRRREACNRDSACAGKARLDRESDQ